MGVHIARTKVLGAPKAGVMDCCEPLKMGPGNLTWVLYMPLTTEQSLQPCVWVIQWASLGHVYEHTVVVDWIL